MKWHKTIRGSGLIEWECEHGVGHPDLNSAKEIADKFGHDAETWATHGCDGCCNRDDFPGNIIDETTQSIIDKHECPECKKLWCKCLCDIKEVKK